MPRMEWKINENNAQDIYVVLFSIVNCLLLHHHFCILFKILQHMNDLQGLLFNTI